MIIIDRDGRLLPPHHEERQCIRKHGGEATDSSSCTLTAQAAEVSRVGRTIPRPAASLIERFLRIAIIGRSN